MISDKFKQTLSNSLTFTTLSLTITMLQKCISILQEKGVSPQTLSFFVCGLDKLTQELQEGYEYIKINEDFQTIIQSIKDSIKQQEKDE